MELWVGSVDEGQTSAIQASRQRQTLPEPAVYVSSQWTTEGRSRGEVEEELGPLGWVLLKLEMVGALVGERSIRVRIGSCHP